MMIRDAHPVPGGVRERPGLYVVGKRNPQFLRTIPGLPRDEKDADDVNTDAEDHTADEVRYRVRSNVARVRSGRTTGMG